MINIVEIAAIILLTLLIGSLFYFGFRRRGPWGSFWSFILILFLGVVLFDVYTNPIGPIYYGIAWIDLLVIGLLFAFLLAASGRSYPRKSLTQPSEERRDAVAIGLFFWGLVVFFILAIFFRIFLQA